ncbi:hypothetical protein LZ31DRAFT_621246 [Colletotrichum somersetense]|nr:hypothetical protein LZ31DRAFT_621246 [Colletotrichum somersetense]
MVNFWSSITLVLSAKAVASHVLRPAPAADVQSDISARAIQDRCPGRCPGQGSRWAPKSCDDFNFVFTGLPWNHPAINASGFTPQQVEAGIRSDVKAIVDAGYNIKGYCDALQSLQPSGLKANAEREKIASSRPELAWLINEITGKGFCLKVLVTLEILKFFHVE